MDSRRKASARWMLLELSIGVAIVLLVGYGAWLAATPHLGDTDVVWIGPVAMRHGVLTALVAIALALTGLTWMLRIFHGSRDQPPPWRHRDR